MASPAEARIRGNLTRDPEIKLVGTPPQEIVEFTIAANVTKEKTIFYNITAWKNCVRQAKTLTKGDMAIVTGTPEAEAYISRKGEEPKAIPVNKINAFEVYKIQYTKKEDGEGRF